MIALFGYHDIYILILFAQGANNFLSHDNKKQISQKCKYTS